MANAKTIEILKGRLKDIFCNEKKYSEVWLSDIDFGGLYQSDKFVVNVKVEHEIDSCNDEIKNISNILYGKLSKDEFSMIWRIVVYNAFEEIHCESEDILVYSEEESCNP
jgi:hypothetical protein